MTVNYDSKWLMVYNEAKNIVNSVENTWALYSTGYLMKILICYHAKQLTKTINRQLWCLHGFAWFCMLMMYSILFGRISVRLCRIVEQHPAFSLLMTCFVILLSFNLEFLSIWRLSFYTHIHHSLSSVTNGIRSKRMRTAT